MQNLKKNENGNHEFMKIESTLMPIANLVYF